MAYLTDGLVGGFDLWELATSRADAGRRAAQSLGLSERVRYQMGDAFAAPRERAYDLIHWDHSLHHMSDVEDALAWSVSVLRPGGVVLINDYIGPNRLQWTRAEVDLANDFLDQADAPGPRVRYSNLITRLKMWRKDPSEAPQSERILAACARHLPGAEIAPIGGTLLDILGGVVIPRTSEEDPLVDRLVQADGKARAEGFSHFAFGIWSAV
jgi:SAM-dependent methyltransferase